MNREIKFRGKRVDNGEWVYGCLIIEEPPMRCFSSDEKEICQYLIGKSGFADWDMPRPFTAAKVYPESVGQYTGLKDKNGKEVYEGDILMNPESKIGAVVFNDGCFRLQIYKSNTSEHYITMNQGYCLNKEVIGNIFERPELLNQ